MAKYIDVEEIESEELKHYRNSLNEHDAKLFVEFMSWIDDVIPADVVEQEKYEMMAERCKAMTNDFIKLKNENKELQKKIDNAIEEIKKQQVRRSIWRLL